MAFYVTASTTETNVSLAAEKWIHIRVQVGAMVPARATYFRYVSVKFTVRHIALIVRETLS